ncbi:unnamed protein product [Paramecium octaurelia]|uniref:Methyltransferase domain-containing protein n=1 Tax=Paramecium octaurelia TaxID=43137 RepID=A0A8S1WSD6_PAROT|nr:unnamed protein product [Paramecium octaurelia]
MVLLLALSNEKFLQNTFNNQCSNQMLQYQFLDKTTLILRINQKNSARKQKRIWFTRLQNGVLNIFGEPKNEDTINNLKRFTSNKLEFDTKNYAALASMPQLMQQIQRLGSFSHFSFLICGYPRIKFQSNHLVLHKFECLNQQEQCCLSESSRMKGLNQKYLQQLLIMNKSQQEAIQKNHYGKLEYWERRYSENDKPFEWYQNYDNLKDIVTQYINHNSRILNIGCGNSNIPEDMYKEGYQWIVNLDFSKAVIEFMKEKFKSYPAHFQFVLADARELPFPNDSFDCVFDKGLLDAVLSGDYSAQNSKKVINHIYRALKKETGVYIVISHGFPEQRLPYLSKSEYNWKVTYSKVYKPDVRTKSLEFDASDLNNYHFIYVCKMDRYQGQTAAQVIGI